ncbi:sensor histidine kinase KdpD [uncultured Oscillibacter sp.]|uniref:sensor histidine kinase n=1 Tax=uncultured Oscillibacter sp. TaxID=876091 RepID=UPI00266F0583|nr:HAMP domain-containing sensor histidine kinase [uncultured Oscillibacter sp.]
MKRTDRDEYSVFHSKLTRRVCGSVALSVLTVTALYRLLWKRRMGDVIVWFLVNVLDMSRQEAFYFYSDHFRLNKDLFFCGAVFLVFAMMLWQVFRGMSRYFSEINRGIESLLADDGEQIHLSPEMLPFERKLNAVKRTLAERKEQTALAERRKDELVMYLAHDVRTPLTSVIGYLNLLEEEPDSPPEQRAKRVRIALDKAYRLETMMNEFFEITRYNSQQITLSRAAVDLYYLLVQLTDELTPVLAERGNTVALRMDENLTVRGDAEKLARVFGNILKNAAAYSDPQTEITVSARRAEQDVIIRFQNRGEDIPAEKLEALFDKFYRLDQARSTGTGGTGLGLAIAKEIVLLHGGSIQASSENHTVTFAIRLPGGEL